MVVTTNSSAQTVHRYPIRWGATAVLTCRSGTALPTDLAAMIGAHRARESDVPEGAEDLEQVHAAAGRGMGGLVKLAVTRDPDVATVCEVNAPSQPTDHGRQIVLGARAERAGTERQAVRRTVHECHEALQRSGTGDDPRQAEDRPGRVIRMDREPHAGPPGHRHDT